MKISKRGIGRIMLIATILGFTCFGVMVISSMDVHERNVALSHLSSAIKASLLPSAIIAVIMLPLILLEERKNAKLPRCPHCNQVLPKK